MPADGPDIPHENPESALEQREHELYARENRERLPNVRSRLHQTAHVSVPHTWAPKPDTTMKKRFWQSPLSLALLAGIIFFFASLAFFAFSLLTNRTVVSPDNVEITVSGPISVAAGEELQLQLSIQNNNPVPIEVADLIVEYPLGARRADSARTAITKPDRDFIGTLAPGQAVNRTIHTVLFGETDEEQEFAITLEYRPEGSNATLETRKAHTLPLSAAPVSLAVELPNTISTDEDFEGVIRVRSNAKTVLEDINLIVKYPPGFIFYDAEPQPASGQDTFALGDLLPGAERRIAFNGTLLGQDGELKTFTFTIGEGGESSTIAVAFNSTTRTITMVRPSLAAVLTINNDSGTAPAVLSGEEGITGTLAITNNHANRVIGLNAAIRIIGDALDPSSVEAADGFFRSLDQTIVWDRESGDFKTAIEPGGTIFLSFAFRLVSPSARINLANARSLTLDIVVNGRLTTPDEEFADLVAASSREVRVNSDLSITGRSVHFVGPFQNTGSVPPRVNQPTTYTILWAITNGTNDIRDARAVAKLPPYALFVGTVEPASESVRFNPETGEVVWNAGIVRAGTGISRPVREVAFQVQITPSAPQVNQILTLIGDAILRGNDTFTNRALESTTRALSTVLITDPDFTDGMQVVVP